MYNGSWEWNIFYFLCRWPPDCSWYTSITSSFSISSCLGVSWSLIRLPSNKKRSDVIGTPWNGRVKSGWSGSQYTTYDTLRVTSLQFGHRCGHLDPEVDFIGILSNHLKFDVLGISVITGLRFRFLSSSMMSTREAENILLTSAFDIVIIGIVSNWTI